MKWWDSFIYSFKSSGMPHHSGNLLLASFSDSPAFFLLDFDSFPHFVTLQISSFQRNFFLFFLLCKLSWRIPWQANKKSTSSSSTTATSSHIMNTKLCFFSCKYFSTSMLFISMLDRGPCLMDSNKSLHLYYAFNEFSLENLIIQHLSLGKIFYEVKWEV